MLYKEGCIKNDIVHVPAKSWINHTCCDACNISLDTVSYTEYQHVQSAVAMQPCAWLVCDSLQEHTLMHKVLIFLAQGFFPFHWRLISWHTTEAERLTVAQWSLLQPALSSSPCLMHKYPHAKGKIPSGQDVESVYCFLNLNLNLYGGVAPIWPRISIFASSAEAV